MTISLTARLSNRILVAMLLWACMAVSVSAHASLTGTLPRDGSVVATPPAIMTLAFSEPVSPTNISLTKPDGRSVKLDQVTLRDRTLEIAPPSDLALGTYVISWRVVSEDGHPIGGSVVFSIGSPSAAQPVRMDDIDLETRAGLWIGKLALYLGLSFGIGGVFAMHWFADGSRHGLRVVALALGTGLAGTLISAGFQGLDAAGVPVSGILDASVLRAGFATSFGRTVVFMIAALSLSALALANGPGRSGRWISLGGLLTGAFALCLSGHASAADPQWLMRPAVFLHAAAITVWIGALVPLMAHFKSNSPIARSTLRRFSLSIPVTVVILFAAGVILAIVQVREPEALLETSYGKVLLFKLGLLVILFLLAALNRWKLTSPVMAGHMGAERALVRSVMAETLIVLLVFGAAATWRFTPPPRALLAAAAQPAMVSMQSDKGLVELTMTPGRAGAVTASAEVMTRDLSPMEAQEISFVFSNSASGIEPIRRKARKGQNGSWIIDDLVLPVAGTWSVRADILISDFEIAKLQGDIEIRP